MDFNNHTPFPSLPFESLTSNNEQFFVVAVRGTFNIINGRALRPCANQEPLVLADQYLAAPNSSSLKWPNDLSPVKLNTDIQLVGSAKSAQPCRQWDVSLSVGSLRHSVTVTGPREWRYSLLRDWTLTEPETCTEVELKYELAFGGTWEHEKNNAFSEMNPIGRGITPSKYADRRQPIAAPQIVSSKQMFPVLGQLSPPAGFGPIPPSWIQRRQFAGTYDVAWQESQAPLPPHDFKYDFYNSAHPDLIYAGFLKGNEAVEIEGVTGAEPIRFLLPDYSMGAVLTDESGYRCASFAELDTVQIDVDAMRVYLVWRLTAPILDDPIRRVQLKMEEHSSQRQREKQVQRG